MAWFGKKKEQLALPAPAAEPVRGEITGLTKPAKAKYGKYFTTRTFLNTESPDYAAAKMEAILLPTGWRVMRSDIAKNNVNLSESTEKLVHNRQYDKSADGLDFWSAMKQVAEFNALMSRAGWLEIGPTAEELGNEYFRAFARREGTIGFDTNGLPMETHEGMIPVGGLYFEKDLLDLYKAHADEKQGNTGIAVTQNPSQALSQIFAAATGPMIDYKNFVQSVELRGYLEEIALAAADVRKVFGRFDMYFEGEQRRQTVDKWLKEARADLRKSMLPEKFKNFSLTLKDILESETLKAAATDDANPDYSTFAHALKNLATAHLDSLGSDFEQCVKRLDKYIDRVDAASENNGKDGASYDTAYLKTFVTTLQFAYHAFRAKAQFEFVNHVKGDKTAYLNELNDTVETIRKLMKKIDGGNRAAEFTADEVISMPRPSLEFIDKIVGEFSRAIATQTNGSSPGLYPADEQLLLPLEQGENGLTRHRLEVDLDGFLERVRAEKGEKFAADMMEQIGALSLLNSSSVGSVATRRAITGPTNGMGPR